MIKGGAIAITFDDGNKSDLTVGMQAMLDRGLPAKGTSYIIGSYIGNANRLTQTDLIDMIGQGWDIQCHSWFHNLGGPTGGMTGMTAAELVDDMKRENDFFVNTLGIPAPQHHAYPGGASNDLMHNIMGRYRKTFRTTQAQFFTKDVNKFRIPSFSFEQQTEADLARYRAIIDFVMANNLPLIVFLHDLTTPEQISAYGQILDYLKLKNTRLMTVSELYETVWSGK